MDDKMTASGPLAPTALQDLLQGARIIPALTGLLGDDQECYLVGGALRNALLGLAVNDFDFTLPEDPTGLARKFAKRLGGHWFFLDEVRLQSRVVLKTPKGVISYDFAPFRSHSLEGDLQLRDFTVNALALPLSRSAEWQQVIDPLGGRVDLAGGILRCCSDTVLADDPLRVLKGVRHCVSLDLQPVEETLSRLSETSDKLQQMAPERIRSELGRIFSLPAIAKRLDLLNDIGLDNVLFGPTDRPDGFLAGCDLLLQAEVWFEWMRAHDETKSFSPLFDESVESDWSRCALLKLATFLHGYGVQGIDSMARDRFRFSRRATALLGGFLALRSQRYSEISTIADTPRGRALWVASLDVGRGEALLLLAAISGADPSRDGEYLKNLLIDYLTVADAQGRIADLIGGDWLRTELLIDNGPLIGAFLALLRRAEIKGLVSSIQDAKEFLYSLHANKD